MRFYDGDHTYDIEPELLEASKRVSTRRAARVRYDEANERVFWQRHYAEPSIAESAIARHERRYGSEGVEEVLRYLGLCETSQNGPPSSGEKRPVSRSTRERRESPSVPAWDTTRKANLGRKILHLHGRGRMPAAIADALGKSETVVRRYLREAAVA